MTAAGRPDARVRPAPVGGVTLMVEGTDTVNLNRAFNEPEGEALTFTATLSKPAIATANVDRATGILTVTAVAVGETEVTVIAKDPGGLKAQQTFDVTVTEKVMEPEPPVTIDDVKTEYPTLTINPATSSMMEIELPADHDLKSAKPAVVYGRREGRNHGCSGIIDSVGVGNRG